MNANVNEVSTKTIHYKNFLTAWFLFDYCLPIIFIVVFWPIGLYLLKIPFAFEKVLSSADLMPIASLLMLAVSREIDMENKLGRITNEMDTSKYVGLFLSILILLFYACFKYYYMTYSFPINSDVNLDEVISIIPYISFATVICALTFCFSTKWRIINSLR